MPRPAASCRPKSPPGAVCARRNEPTETSGPPLTAAATAVAADRNRMVSCWLVNRAAGTRRAARTRRLTSMHGLTIRWSLTGGPEGVEDALRAYVEATSHGRYSGRKDLRFKTWRMRDGEWFEGCYVFETPGARATFERDFRAAAAGSPSSQIIGSAPVLIEPCEIVAVAEGASGFIESASFG